MWKAELKIGTTRIPVKLYAAVGDRQVRFHILDKHKARVKQHMVTQDDKKEVATEAIQKGYEIEPGRFVLLSEDDLTSLVPKASRDIEVSGFLSPDKIGQQFYERPYYLGPDGNTKDYFALAEALSTREKEGLATWVMRNKAYTGALRADNGYLMLYTLRSAEEVIQAKELPKPGGRAPTQKEVAMAKDEYRERVMEFVAKKAKGHAPRLRAVKTKRSTAALDSVLEKSIVQLKKGKRAA
jgi:DNA end-binding protein Ku